jgi:YaaC-like Protein
MSIPSKSFELSIPTPPFQSFEYFSEPPTAYLMWKNLNVYVDLQDRGLDLFTGTRAERVNVWRDFKNFLRQAEAYYWAGSQVEGSSASLLYYYCALNLAKAELLTDPTFRFKVLNQEIHHGLSYRPLRAKTLSGDQLRVTDGVFPLLYERRVGHTIPLQQQISVKRLLGNVPEIGWELERARIGSAQVVGGLHAIAMDDKELWSLLALCEPLEPLTSNTVTGRLFQRHFELVDPPGDWKSLFAFTRRLGPGYGIFQAKRSQPRSDKSFSGIRRSDIYEVIKGTWRDLTVITDASTVEDYDILICPSLLRSKLVPMPPSLARYALMHYTSSLVRYKPSALDRNLRSEQAWLLDAFTTEAALPLLQNALSGIEGRPRLYMSGLRV